MKLYLLVALLTITTLTSLGQMPAVSPPVENDEPIKINTLLINVPVIASDKDGRYIAGLSKENFLVTEDGEKRPIEYFADVKAPMNVAILVDCSPSIRPFIKKIQEAARDFIKVIRPEDRALIAGFDSRIYLFSEFTSDQTQLRKAINRTGVSGLMGSNMQDSIHELLTRQFASVKGRKAIIVLTDGAVDGRIRNDQLLSVLAESDVLVYPIMFEANSISYRNSFPQKFRMPNGEIFTREQIMKNYGLFMASMATISGGRFYDQKSGDFKTIFQNIADELKNQYVIGFYPQYTDDRKPHRIAIEAAPKDIVIRSKRVIRMKSPD